MYTTYYINGQITDSVTQTADRAYTDVSSLTIPPWPLKTPYSSLLHQAETKDVLRGQGGIVSDDTSVYALSAV